MSSIEFRKDLFADERDDTLKEIGKPTIRQDILGHVTGRTKYYDDHLFDGLLHMRCVRSPHHHARIRHIDTAAAERLPGVVRVVRAADVPNNLNTLLSLIGFGRDDEELICSTKVAYEGAPVLAVIATSERAARDACAAVRVEWEVLPHVLDPEEALRPGAPVVNEAYPNNSFDYHGIYDHQKLRFGDTEAALAAADHIVEAEYQLSPIEQAPMETCGAIAAPETNDRFVCHTSTQALFFSLGTTAKLLDMASSRLHFIGGTVGGGFGGKVDSIVEPMSVLGAKLTGRPVKFMWDRPEEMQVGAPRGAERWRIRDGVMADGRIMARQFTGFFDAGATVRLSSYAIIKGTGHLPGPYSIPNVAANVFCVFTNRTPATAMRGFGITAVDFAIEVQMDRVAEAVGMDPIELRILNAYRDGDMKPHRRVAKNTALIECCQVAAGKAGWALSPAAAAASSLQGGGGARAEIPETVTDQMGRIGERRQRDLPTAPLEGTTAKGRVPAGQQGIAIYGAAPQRDDMQIEPERVGHRTSNTVSVPAAAVAPAGSGPSGGQAVPPAAARGAVSPPPGSGQASGGAVSPPPGSGQASGGAVSPPPGSGPSHSPPPRSGPAISTPPPSATANAPVPGQSHGRGVATGAPQSPPAGAPSGGVQGSPASSGAAGTGQPDPYKPELPFQRGVKRPGVSRFISGTRRR